MLSLHKNMFYHEKCQYQTVNRFKNLYSEIQIKAEQTRTSYMIKVGSGALEEKATPADRSHHK